MTVITLLPLPLVWLLAVSSGDSSFPIYQLGPIDGSFQLVANTWPWLQATNTAWQKLVKTDSSLDAIVAGCSKCEELQCDHTVGYGGSPDTTGETTLDAMIMYGPTHDAGSVGDLREIKDAIRVARAVMDYTDQTLLVGSRARDFAVEMGFTKSNLTTNYSLNQYQTWLAANCQPNYYKNCINQSTSCPPYKPMNISNHSLFYNDNSDSINMNINININKFNTQKTKYHNTNSNTNSNSVFHNDNHNVNSKLYNIERNKDRNNKIPTIDQWNHDTIGMIAVETDGTMSVGTTTNGANHKIAGRVGDSPIIGSGGYVEQGIGAAVATGDGDVMMRFAPTKEAVLLMKYDKSPTDACVESLLHIGQYYPTYQGAMVCVAANGSFGGASVGWSDFFQFAVRDSTMNQTTIFLVNSTRDG